MKANREYDILMLALPRWDSKYASTSISLAKEFANKHRVFVIDNPFTVIDYFRYRNQKHIRRRRNALLHGQNIISKIPGYPDNFFSVTPRLTLPINWLPKGIIYQIFKHINEKIVARAIRKVIEVKQIKNYIFINSFNPLFFEKPKLGLAPLLYIYHIVDDISESVYVKKHGSYLEPLAVKAADLVVVTSMELKRLYSNEAIKLIHIPNAANIELFNTAVSYHYPIPKELINITNGKKVITYIGNLDIRVDYEILVAVAHSFPECTLLLVGPIGSEEYKGYQLENYSNVIMTGGKKLTELPAYLRHSHVGLIPFKRNKLTKSIYPLKVNEYLAAGLPVVSTCFSDDIDEFKKIISLADDLNSFIELLRLALLTDGDKNAKGARMKFSKQNDWKNRGEIFLQNINELLEKEAKENRDKKATNI